MPVSGNDYFGTLGADATGIENIIDQNTGGGRLANWVAGNQSTGAGSALLGSNSPAVTVSAPNTWWKVTLTDGSTGFIPVWK